MNPIHIPKPSLEAYDPNIIPLFVAITAEHPFFTTHFHLSLSSTFICVLTFTRASLSDIIMRYP
jgi:hypothetical protein